MPSYANNYKYRLKLDVGETFSSTPGKIISKHHSEFWDEKDSFSGTWREPVTGVVMLKPNFYTPSSRHTDAVPITSMRRSADYWREAKREGIGATKIPLWSNVSLVENGVFTPFVLVSMLNQLAIDLIVTAGDG